MKLGKKERISFAKTSEAVDLPDLLDIQLKSFDHFLQPDVPPEERENKGLQEVFSTIFPIVDTRENYLLEFIAYYLEQPKYSVDECRERGVTYSVPLKAKLRLSIRDELSESKDYSETIDQIVYLGNIPIMTDRGTFVINGAERIVVSQLHRSPGAFFSEMLHPNGTKIFSARIIPLRGSWVEFTTDINDVMYVYIDRRKKFPVTTLLRALGFSSDREILSVFDLVEEVDLKEQSSTYLLSRIVFEDIIDKETGELIVEKDAEIDEETIGRIEQAGLKKINLIRVDEEFDAAIIPNTLKKDPAKSEEAALEAIYRLKLSNGNRSAKAPRDMCYQ